MARRIWIALLSATACAHALAAQPTPTPQQPADAPAENGQLTSPTPKVERTLAECIQIAERGQPDILAARDMVDAATAHVRVAKAGFLPRLSVGQSYARATYNQAATVGTSPLEQNLFYDGQHNSNAGYFDSALNFSQNIYDFGRTRHTIEGSQADLAAARDSLERTRQVVALNVRLAYYAVLADEELVRVADAGLAQQRKHLAQIKAMYEVGTRPKIDLSRQEVEESNARVSLTQATEDLTVARGALATAMGVAIADSPEPADSLKQKVEAVPLADLIAQARANRPDLRVARDQLDAAHAAVLLAETAFRPAISLGSFFDYRNLRFPLVYNWSLGQVLSQNIFNGGADRAMVAQLESSESAQTASLNALEERVSQAVYADYADLHVAEQKIDLAIETEAEAKEARELAEGRYTGGYGNIIELTDAQFSETSSQAQEVSARYQYQAAAAALDADTGKVAPVKILAALLLCDTSCVTMTVCQI